MELMYPNSLKEFQGKKEILDNFKIYLDDAKKNGVPLDHCLFHGSCGTGKKTLAIIIAKELGQRIKIIQGANLQKPTDIINLALTLQENDVLLIDDVDQINPPIKEILYSIMEDFSIDICLGNDFNSKITRVQLPKFTLIGTTNNLGKISECFEERFGIIVYFGEYQSDEMINVVKFYNEKYLTNLTDDEIKLISKNSKGIPRVANKIVRRVKDFRTICKSISVATILKRIGIIKNGINAIDLKYLEIINDFDMPVGIKTISHAILLDETTIENKIEPYLIQCGYINRTIKGQVITEKGKKFLLSI